jgi:peptide chain release factor 1
MAVSDARLAQIAARFAELEARLASGTLEGEGFVAASRDYAELEPVARAARAVQVMRSELASLAALDEPDAEMRALADEEMQALRGQLPEAERALAIAMLPRDRPTCARPCWKSAPAPAATKPRCSPPTCSACTNALPPSRAGKWT